MQRTPETIRLQAGFDMSHLAALAGVSGPTIGRIERGETRSLRPLTLQKIGSVLAERLKKNGIEFSVNDYIEICVSKRDERMRALNQYSLRRSA